eukprot:762721-Hanusia_phi.AAC.3
MQPTVLHKVKVRTVGEKSTSEDISITGKGHKGGCTITGSCRSQARQHRDTPLPCMFPAAALQKHRMTPSTNITGRTTEHCTENGRFRKKFCPRLAKGIASSTLSFTALNIDLTCTWTNSNNTSLYRL